MQLLPITLLDVLAAILPASLSCLGTFWLFYRFLRLISPNIGFSMVLILGVSDLLQSVVVLLDTLIPGMILNKVSNCLFFLSIYFSIFWASSMSFLVYRSIKYIDFNSKIAFIKTLIFVFILSLLFTVV